MPTRALRNIIQNIRSFNDLAELRTDPQEYGLQNIIFHEMLIELPLKHNYYFITMTNFMNIDCKF